MANNSINLTLPGERSRTFRVSYPDSMVSAAGQSYADLNLDLQDHFHWHPQAEGFSSECAALLHEDEMVFQYPSLELDENVIDFPSNLVGCYRSSIFLETEDKRKMQKNHVLDDCTLDPQIIPIYSSHPQAAELTPHSLHVFSHNGAPGLDSAPSAVHEIRLNSTADASPSPFLYSPDAELAAFPNGTLRGDHGPLGFSSSPSISRQLEVNASSPFKSCALLPSSSLSSSPSSSSLRAFSPLQDITNLYSSSPTGNAYDEIYQAMFAQPYFSPVIRASSPPGFQSLAAARPSLSRTSDASLDRHSFTTMIKNQNPQPSTPQRKKSLTMSICERIDALLSPFVDRTPERSQNSESSTLSSPLSPLTPLTDDGRLASRSLKNFKPVGQRAVDSSPYNVSDSKRKRRALGSPTPSYPTKRARPDSQISLAKSKKGRLPASLFSPERASSTVSKLTDATIHQGLGGFVFTQRTFPRQPIGQDFDVKGAKLGLIEISDEFSLFYRRFPASSYFRLEEDDSECALFKVPHPGGTYNRPRSAFDLYTPRFVKGKGKEKIGLCPICIESTERGGEGKKIWLAMKFSAYKCYHMQYSHGISASSSLPFSPPLAFRTVNRPSAQKTEKSVIKEGKCHKCLKWVPVEGIKDIEVKVKELFWWKHAAACHSTSTLDGETDVFEEDEVFEKLRTLVSLDCD